MTHKPVRAGLPTHLTLPLPTTWSPEQALAVVELLDDLREHIWRHYNVALYEITRELYGPSSDPVDDRRLIDDPPF